jgi:hypothetical protein
MLEPPPEVLPGLQLFMQAFWDLCSDRGPTNRIQWTAIHLYARSLGLSYGEERDMVYLVTRLDLAYLEWAKGRQSSGNNAQAVQQQHAQAGGANPRQRPAQLPPNRSRN